MQTQIKRSRTGTYHLGLGNTAHCNGRSMNVSLARKNDVIRASAACFCTKCFSAATIADRARMLERYEAAE